MTIDQIERIIDTDTNRLTKIVLKARTVEGVFIEATDFLELKKKNLWRIVTASRIEEYGRSKDLNLSRIFNGQEFVRIASR